MSTASGGGSMREVAPKSLKPMATWVNPSWPAARAGRSISTRRGFEVLVR